MAIRLTYCTVADVDLRARDESQTAWQNLTSAQKNEIIYYATDDILAYHEQPSDYGQLWGYQYLRNAATGRCLYLARNIAFKSLKEKTDYIGFGSVSDGIMSLSDRIDSKLDPATKSAVNMVMKRLGVNQGEFLRG